MKTFEEILREDGSLFYRSRGASMLPLIREGRDFVYIEKIPEGRLNKLDVALYTRQRTDGEREYVLHRVLKVNPDGTYWIVGDNCTDGDTVEVESIIGVLSAVKRRGRTVKVTDFGYRLYACLWCAPYPVRIFITKLKNKAKRAAGKLLRILH